MDNIFYFGNKNQQIEQDSTNYQTQVYAYKRHNYKASEKLKVTESCVTHEH